MLFEELTAIAEKTKSGRKQVCVRCCMSAGCMSSQADEIKKSLELAVAEKNLADKVEIRRVGCMGFCGKGPMVSVEEKDDTIIYQEVTPENAPSIIGAIAGGKAEAELGDSKHPFFTHQMPVVRSHGGRIDPEQIDGYIEVGGYTALHHVIQDLSPSQVVEIIMQSGLRGRGGAGYPSGLKWSMVAKAKGEQKYIVCNGDEGDPGAFMDRSVLESDPHTVIEGMAIAGYAVGASLGYIYVRAEYPLAINRLQLAIKQAKKHGLLGDGLFDSTFNFNIEIRIGAGAFVCGEETALIASIEGRRGQPRPRPPFPA